MDAEDRSIEGEHLLKVLHGALMKTAAPQKYPAVQYYNYGLAAKDYDTSPEELDKIVDTVLSGELASTHKDYVDEILVNIARHRHTRVETLEALHSGAAGDKSIIRTIQSNPQLENGWTKESRELAKKIMMTNLGDDTLFTRGTRQIARWSNNGVIPKEEAREILSKAQSGFMSEKDRMEQMKKRQTAGINRWRSADPNYGLGPNDPNYSLREHKIKIRIRR